MLTGVLSNSEAMSYLKTGKLLVWTITIDPVIGSTLNLDSSDIIENSLSINRNSVSGDVIEIGSAETTELKFSLDNFNGQYDSYTFEGANVYVKVSSNGIDMPFGYFTIDTQPKKDGIINIVALDYMAKFNRPYEIVEDTTISLNNLLTSITTLCGVTKSSSIGLFLNYDYVVNLTTDLSGTSCHQLLIWIAELAGCCAWINQLGELELSWYGENQGETTFDITSSDYFDYTLEENNITITGIVVKMSNQEDQSFGTEGYQLVIEENKLLNFDDINTRVSPINDKINGYTYRPVTFNMYFAPFLWPFDEVNFITQSSESIPTIIMKSNLNISGETSMIAVGESEILSGYASVAPFTASQKRVLTNIASVETNRQLSSYETASLALNKLIANSNGMYETDFPDISNGGFFRVMHDQPSVYDSKYIYKQTALAFAYANDGDINPYPNCTFNSGLGADGHMIARVLDVISINADWIRTGDLTVGGDNHTGAISVLDALNQEIATIDKYGINVVGLIGAIGFTGNNGVSDVEISFVGTEARTQLKGLYTDYYDPIIFKATHNRASYSTLGTSIWNTDADYLNIGGENLNSLIFTSSTAQMFFDITGSTPELRVPSASSLKISNNTLLNESFAFNIADDGWSIYSGDVPDPVYGMSVDAVTGIITLDSGLVDGLTINPDVSFVASIKNGQCKLSLSDTEFYVGYPTGTKWISSTPSNTTIATKVTSTEGAFTTLNSSYGRFTSSTDINSGSETDIALQIGAYNVAHMLIDSNEIQAVTANGAGVTDLGLNQIGGNIFLTTNAYTTQIPSTTEITALDTAGIPFEIGTTNSYRLRMDRKKIQAENGTSSSELSLNILGGTITIGSNGYRTIINSDTDIDELNDSDIPLQIGKYDAAHMMIDSNEIQCVTSNGGAANTLNLQTLGGDVTINGDYVPTWRVSTNLNNEIRQGTCYAAASVTGNPRGSGGGVTVLVIPTSSSGLYGNQEAQDQHSSDPTTTKIYKRSWYDVSGTRTWSSWKSTTLS